MRIWERAKQICVEHAEHRRVGSDAERERQHGHGGEAFVLEQHSHSITQILEHFVLPFLWLQEYADDTDQLEVSDRKSVLVSQAQERIRNKRKLTKQTKSFRLFRILSWACDNAVQG
jgi:hypothetical protein